ncbi:gamma-glutamylcyclotransferase [Fuscibacter oryzae]|uniref:glutathione-specific gamma-glutamylcyclotransferase n=1 Tax=Fuscibacter oryzae TaxID=2803939 RepID=A0A8J7MS51_9RHOB|nr:gamma-glutamylcyclotransferase [Fuscibacter oryzae]MBL4927925.1 gamma-glutamylcyclotransferase [Fuscibacter oryzae]
MPQRRMTLTEAHVARTRREVVFDPDSADLRGWTRLDDTAIAEAADVLLAERPAGPLWVFAYGSLIWKPEFTPVRTLPCDAPGWHRAFTIGLTSWRGTPEAPGLMMALMPGGHCRGLALQVAAGEERAALIALITRETPYLELLPSRRWLVVETAEGQLTALTFYAPPLALHLRRGLTQGQTAALIARACGYVGPNSEYVLHTVAALEAHGIHDRSLWRLQKLVAQEIEALEKTSTN